MNGQTQLIELPFIIVRQILALSIDAIHPLTITSLGVKPSHEDSDAVLGTLGY